MEKLGFAAVQSGMRERLLWVRRRTARTLAVLVYHVLKGDFTYKDPGADVYDAQQRARQLRSLRQGAGRVGFALVSQETGEVS